MGAVECGDLWVWNFEFNSSLPAFALVFDFHFFLLNFVFSVHSVLCIPFAQGRPTSVCSFISLVFSV